MFTICYVYWPTPPLEFPAFKKVNLRQENWALIFITWNTPQNQSRSNPTLFICIITSLFDKNTLPGACMAHFESWGGQYVEFTSRMADV